jgi:hypothetical protein
VNDSDRFDYFSDPFDRWTIWDNCLERPACFSGILMAGLSLSEARSMWRLLNHIKRAKDEMERPRA